MLRIERPPRRVANLSWSYYFHTQNSIQGLTLNSALPMWIINFEPEALEVEVVLFCLDKRENKTETNTKQRNTKRTRETSYGQVANRKKLMATFS